MGFRVFGLSCCCRIAFAVIKRLQRGFIGLALDGPIGLPYTMAVLGLPLDVTVFLPRRMMEGFNLLVCVYLRGWFAIF